MRNYFYIVQLLLSCLLSKTALCQSLVFRNYNTVQGLTSSEVYNSFQDSKGYMWLCTDRGIVRFDGYAFRPFSSADGMPDNTVFQVFEDAKGRIWFVTYSLKIGYIEDEHVHIYPYNSLIKARVPYALSDMYVDKDDNVWIGWDEPFNYRLIHITPNGQVDSSYDCTKSKTKKIYVPKKGICILSGSKQSENIEYISLETREFLASYPAKKERSVNPRAWYIKRKDKIWTFIDNQLSFIVNKKQSRIIDCEGKICSFFVDSSCNIWVGYLNKGVQLFTPKNDYTKPLWLLKNYTITSINQDKQGGMWLTSLENGAFYLPPSAPFSYSAEDKLPGHTVRLIQNIEKNILIIFTNGDFAIKAPDKDSFTIYKNTSPLLLNLDIKYKAPDRIFFSGYKELIIPINKKKVYIDDGKVLIGKQYIWSLSYPFAYKYDWDGNHLKEWSFLSISRTRCGLETKSGDLLVGTLDGLYECNNNGIVPYSKYNPIWSKRISDICYIDDNHIAIATIGYGLLVVSNNDFGHPVQYLVKEGLPSIMCNRLYRLDDTTLYLGTNKGLCLINNLQFTAKTRFRIIDTNNGIVSNEINDITECGDDMWVATVNGLSIIPKGPGPINSPSPIYVEKVTVNDRIVNKNTNGSFSYQDNKISFYFTGINFEYAGKLLYAYRLSPADKKWNYTNNRSIIYNSLAPGKYVMEIAVIDPVQKLPGIPVSYSFEIMPPFWQTWWFIGLVGLSLVGGINGFIRYRIRVVKAREQLNNDLQNLKEKALRAQMKPHFIYNSLNSVQNYILKNEMSTSVAFLSKFSRLMRLTFSNTNSGLVSLKDDIEALQLYIDLENLRFRNKINFQINISPTLDINSTMIPPLLIQPFVENAVIHGLHTKEEGCNIWISFETDIEGIKVKIKDNGIGRKQAAYINNKKQKYRPVEIAEPETRDNSGITVTVARIEQIWKSKNNKRMPDKELFTIIDLYDNDIPQGTLIEFYLPYQHDKSNNNR